MSQVSLTTLISSLESGSRPKGGIKEGMGTIPSLGAEHLDSLGGFNFSNTKRIPEEFYLQQKTGKIEFGDILVVKDGATTGKVSFVDEKFPYKKASINEHVFRLKINDKKAHPKFIFHYLRSPLGNQAIMSDFRGATVGGISRGFTDKVCFFIPPLDEQKRIAGILDKADAIRRKRAESLKLLDELLRATFLDMFGDPITNPKNWKNVELGTLLQSIDSGESPRCLDRPANADEWGILKLSAVTKNFFLGHENKAVVSDYKVNLRNEVKAGDLLFSRKNTYELVGAAVLVPDITKKLLLPDLIFRLNLKSDGVIRKEYLWSLLTLPSLRPLIQGLASGASGSMPNISKARLERLVIPLPDIEKQSIFSDIFRKTQISKTQIANAIIESDTLFHSLVDRAFKGELTRGVKDAA